MATLPDPAENMPRAARQDRLLGIARAHFIQKGYRGARMDEIAVSAGLSKRTLYLWHDSKAALFRACVTHGGLQFPMLTADDAADVPAALARFARTLAERLSEPAHFEMGRLLLREQQEFAELAPEERRTHDLYLVQPLAAWLRDQGLERPGDTLRTRLFLAMALATVHEALLIGRDPLVPTDAGQHAALAAGIFLDGARAAG